MRLLFLASAPLILAACATAPGASGAPTATSDAALPARTAARDHALPLTDTTPTADVVSPQGPPAPQGPPPSRNGWRPGEAALQGYLGASWLELDTKGNSIASIQDDDISFPTIGGGGQWKLAGDQVDFGLEALFAFSWRGNVAAFAVGGGGAAVAVDVDLLMWDVYGGPFLSIPLGGRARIYGGAGPLL